MRMNDDGKTVAAADCLVPGIGEIIGGSQRRSASICSKSAWTSWDSSREDYWWYLDLRRYGSCRHAGYGLGFERMVMYLTGVSNIRDVELHPRTTGNADFWISITLMQSAYFLDAAFLYALPQSYHAAVVELLDCHKQYREQQHPPHAATRASRRISPERR